MTRAEQVARGSTLRATLDFVESVSGAPGVQAVLSALSEDDRRVVRAAAPTDDVPFALWRRLSDATAAAIGAAVPDWPERAGAHAIEKFGLKLYAGILRKQSPLEFVNQSVSLFQLYYHPGDMVVVEQEGAGERGGRVVLRLVGFDAECDTFCRRQTGGVTLALIAAGGEKARTRHVRCTLHGDAFCEWELRWS